MCLSVSVSCLSVCVCVCVCLSVSVCIELYWCCCLRIRIQQQHFTREHILYNNNNITLLFAHQEPITCVASLKGYVPSLFPPSLFLLPSKGTLFSLRNLAFSPLSFWFVGLRVCGRMGWAGGRTGGREGCLVCPSAGPSVYADFYIRLCLNPKP